MEPVTTLVWVCAPSLSQASSSTSLRVVTLALGVPREKESALRARGDSNAASSQRAGLVPSGGGWRDAGGRKRGTHLNELHIVAVLHPGSRITDEAEVRCQHRRTDTRAQGEAPAKGRGEGPFTVLFSSVTCYYSAMAPRLGDTDRAEGEYVRLGSGSGGEALEDVLEGVVFILQFCARRGHHGVHPAAAACDARPRPRLAGRGGSSQAARCTQGPAVPPDAAAVCGLLHRRRS